MDYKKLLLSSLMVLASALFMTWIFVRFTFFTYMPDYWLKIFVSTLFFFTVFDLLVYYFFIKKKNKLSLRNGLLILGLTLLINIFLNMTFFSWMVFIQSSLLMWVFIIIFVTWIVSLIFDKIGRKLGW